MKEWCEDMVLQGNLLPYALVDHIYSHPPGECANIVCYFLNFLQSKQMCKPYVRGVLYWATLDMHLNRPVLAELESILRKSSKSAFFLGIIGSHM